MADVSMGQERPPSLNGAMDPRRLRRYSQRNVLWFWGGEGVQNRSRRYRRIAILVRCVMQRRPAVGRAMWW